MKKNFYKKIYILDEDRIKQGVKVDGKIFCLGWYTASSINPKDKDKIWGDSIDEILKKIKEDYLKLEESRSKIFEDFVEKYEQGKY
jgi:hypothetical protein